MSTLFLLPDELVELTGYKYAAGHIQWLKARNWRFETDRDGKPRVMRSYLESKLGGTSIARQKRTEPNFAALDV